MKRHRIMVGLKYKDKNNKFYDVRDSFSLNVKDEIMSNILDNLFDEKCVVKNLDDDMPARWYYKCNLSGTIAHRSTSDHILHTLLHISENRKEINPKKK